MPGLAPPPLLQRQRRGLRGSRRWRGAVGGLALAALLLPASATAVVPAAVVDAPPPSSTPAALHRLVAAPAAPNVAHVYSADTDGGIGREYFTVPSPRSGVYFVTFTASFYPVGSLRAPRAFSCLLRRNGVTRAQSTTLSAGSLNA